MKIFMLSLLVALATSLPVIEPIGGQDAQIIGASVSQPQVGFIVEDSGRIITPEVNIVGPTRSFYGQTTGQVFDEVNGNEGRVLSSGSVVQTIENLVAQNQGTVNSGVSSQLFLNTPVTRSGIAPNAQTQSLSLTPSNNIQADLPTSSAQLTDNTRSVQTSINPVANNFGNTGIQRAYVPYNLGSSIFTGTLSAPSTVVSQQGLPIASTENLRSAQGLQTIDPFVASTSGELNLQRAYGSAISTGPLQTFANIGAQQGLPITSTEALRSVQEQQTIEPCVVPTGISGVQRVWVPYTVGSNVNAGSLPNTSNVQVQTGIQGQINTPLVRSEAPLGVTNVNITPAPESLSLQGPLVTVPIFRGALGVTGTNDLCTSTPPSA